MEQGELSWVRLLVPLRTPPPDPWEPRGLACSLRTGEAGRCVLKNAAFLFHPNRPKQGKEAGRCVFIGAETKEPFLSSLATSHQVGTSGIDHCSLSDPLSDFY